MKITTSLDKSVKRSGDSNESRITGLKPKSEEPESRGFEIFRISRSGFFRIFSGICDLALNKKSQSRKNPPRRLSTLTQYCLEKTKDEN